MVARRHSMDELLAAARAAARELAPGAVPTELLIRLSDGRSIRLPIPPPEPAPAEPEQPLSLEDQVVELLAERGRPMKGTQIAAALRRPYGSTIREALAGMARGGGPLRKAEGGGYELADD